MAKIIDIKGFWNMDYGFDFNDKNIWEGQILLQDDGWFEGVVVDKPSSYKEDRFVFGVYYPRKVIDLYKFTPINMSAPFIFHGEKQVNGYDGQFNVIGLFSTMPCGNSRIVTKEVDLIRPQRIEEEIQKLETKIQRYKNTIMDETGKEFYENTIAMRKTMVESVLRNYEGRGFTQKEIDVLSGEFIPVNDGVMQSTEDEVKRLVKKMPDTIFDDDDDLPF